MKNLFSLTSSLAAAAIFLGAHEEAVAFQLSSSSSRRRNNPFCSRCHQSELGLRQLASQTNANDFSRNLNRDPLIDGTNSLDAAQGTIDRRQFVSQLVASASLVATLSSIPAADAVSADDDIEDDFVSTSFDARYFLAGGGCAAFSHGLATPFDVIKTKMQAEPDIFDAGFLDATKSLVQNDGPSVLLTGLVPTLIGFGVEGAVKFGVYESLKPTFMSLLHTDDKFLPYLAASVGAGIVASAMLCPMERTRIKMVTSGEKTGALGGIGDLIKEEGISSLFFGYTTMLMKQIPYTVTKQVSFELITAQILAFTAAASIAPSEETRFLTTIVSAFFASVLACTISQPGDILLTKTFKENYDDNPVENAIKVYEATGISGFYAGFSARLAHVAAIVTSQLVVYDILKQLLGLPATGT